MLLVLYVVPPAISTFTRMLEMKSDLIAQTDWLGVASPFSALFAIPLNQDIARDNPIINAGNPPLVFGYFGFSAALVAVCVGAMVLRLKTRSGLSDG